MPEKPPDSATELLAKRPTAPPATTTIEALAAVPEEAVWLAKQKSPRTRRAYRADVQHFMRFCGIVTPEQLRQVDHRAVIAWERHMRETEGAEASTVRRRLAALSSLFKHLVEHGRADRNPVAAVPIAPELLPILRDALAEAPEVAGLVVTGVTTPNVWRDFGVIRKRAGTPKYTKWCHTLRKNRESDWINAGFPFHVVVEWMGHSDEVARQHYLRVNEADIDAASRTQIGGNLTQLLTQLAVSEASGESEPEPQVIRFPDVMKKAGDRIRTDDVQLGKLAFYH